MNRIAGTGDENFSLYEAIERIDLGSSAKESGCLPERWYFVSFLSLLSPMVHSSASISRKVSWQTSLAAIRNVKLAFLRLLEDSSLRICLAFRENGRWGWGPGLALLLHVMERRTGKGMVVVVQRGVLDHLSGKWGACSDRATAKVQALVQRRCPGYQFLGLCMN